MERMSVLVERIRARSTCFDLGTLSTSNFLRHDALLREEELHIHAHPRIFLDHGGLVLYRILLSFRGIFFNGVRGFHQTNSFRFRFGFYLLSIHSLLHYFPLPRLSHLVWILGLRMGVVKHNFLCLFSIHLLWCPPGKKSGQSIMMVLDDLII